MQIQGFVDNQLTGYFLSATGYTTYPETGPAVEGGEVSWPTAHINGFKYGRIPALVSLYIPENFHITQALCKVIQGGMVNESPEHTPQYKGGEAFWGSTTLSDGWTPEMNPPSSQYKYNTTGTYPHYGWEIWSTDMQETYNIDYCCGSLSDDFALYYFPGEVVHYEVDAYVTSVMGMQDAYFNVWVEEDSPLVKQLGLTQTGFPSVRNYRINQEDLIVQQYERIIDFTADAKQYFHTGTNTIGLMPTSVPGSVDVRPYTSTRVTGYTNYHSNICVDPYVVEANTKNGFVSLSVIIYGHYNPTQ